MIWGQGLGNPAFPDRGKGYIFKDETGLVLRYISAFGHDRFIKLGEDGIEGVDSDAKTIDIYEMDCLWNMQMGKCMTGIGLRILKGGLIML